MSRRNSGFTLIEVLLAAALSLMLLMGAIVGLSQLYEVARTGDENVHSAIAGRQALDRMLKDIRHAESVVVAGSQQNGWTITIDSVDAGSLDDLIYSWSPITGRLELSDSAGIETVLEGMSDFALTTELNGAEVARVFAHWTLATDWGIEAGVAQATTGFAIAGSTWVRSHVPDF